MSIFWRLLAACGVLGFTAAKLQWTDTYHAVLLGSSFALTLFVWLVSSLRRRSISRLKPRRDVAEPMLRSLFVGSIYGFGTIFFCGCVMSVLAAFHVSDTFYEVGKGEFERIVTALEQAKSYEAASDRIEARLSGPTSARWKQELAERMVKDVVAAGRTASLADEKRRLLQKASKLAAEYGVDSSVATILLTKMDDDAERGRLAIAARTLEGELNDKERKRNDSESAKLRLQGLLAEQERKLHQTDYEKLVAVGDAEMELPLKQQSFVAAIEVAGRYGLDPSSAQRRLDQLAAELLSLRPRQLPALTSIKLLSVRSLPPMHLFELEVNDQSGRHIGGLVAKDFIVTTKRGSCLPASVAEDVLRTETKSAICIALDHSASTSGRPLEEAKRGLQTLLKQLSNHETIPILGFNSTVHPISDIDAVTSAGNTALYAVIEAAVKLLAGRGENRKLLILFTDGRNTVSGPSLEEALRQCVSNKISVHVVALKTAETDQETLTRIAKETGGSLELESIDSLASTLAKKSELSVKHIYRVVVKSDLVRASELQIQVGAEKSRSTSCDLAPLASQ